MAYLGQEEVLSTLWLVNRLVKDSCCLVFASIRQHLVLTLCIYTKCNFSMSLWTGSDCLEDVICCLCPRSCRPNCNLTPFSGFFFFVVVVINWETSAFLSTLPWVKLLKRRNRNRIRMKRKNRRSHIWSWAACWHCSELWSATARWSQTTRRAVQQVSYFVYQRSDQMADSHGQRHFSIQSLYFKAVARWSIAAAGPQRARYSL